MDRWSKFEEWMNQLLERLYYAFQVFVQRKTPDKIKTLAKKTQNGVKAKRSKAQTKAKGAYHKTFKPVILFFKNFGFHISKFQKKVQGLLNSVGVFFTNPKNRGLGKKIRLIFAVTLLPLLLKSKEWALSLKPMTVTMGISLTTLASLTFLSVYKTGENFEKEKARAIASIPQEGHLQGIVQEGARPEYYKIDEKHVTILNIQLPIYIESVSSIKSLRMDFTMIPSNRYIREYLYDHEYLVQDKINVMIEPIIPELPLSDEGRRIIREKIQYEVNDLLDELQIKGEIEEVYIDSILGA